jgi:F0F1-type ATP synthase assembly protein I
VAAADGLQSRGLDYTVEFLSALLVMGGLGWLLDRWLGTAPWLIVIGLVAGNALGIYLLWLHGRSEDELERARRRDEERRQNRRRGRAARG